MRTCCAFGGKVFTQVVLVAWEAMGEINRLDGKWEGYDSAFLEMNKKKTE